MIDLEIQVDTREIEKGLKNFPENIAKKVMRRAVLGGATLIKTRVSRAAPIRREGIRGKYYGGTWRDRRIRYPGFLQHMIGAKYAKGKSNQWQIIYNVRPLGYAFYGFIVEGGHKIAIRPTKSTKRTLSGRVPAHPFMAPVFKNAANEAVARMKVVLEQGILKEWAMTGFQGFARS